MPKKTGRKPISESKAMQETLKDLFLEGGMTPYQAAKNLGIDFKTAQNYFVKFAEEIINDPNHEDWFSREKRVRQRALEGYSNNIQTIRNDIWKYRIILEDKLKKKDDIGIEKFERIVRNQTIMLIELLDNFDALEMEPPTEILLDREIEKRMAARMEIKPNYN